MSDKIKTWIRTGAAVFAVATVILLLIRLHIFTGWFSVREIEVRDNHYLPDSLVLRLSGVRKGADIFALDMEKAIRSLLGNPYVQGVVISRELPYKVMIRIEERNPVAAFHADKKWMLLSDDAVILPLADEIVLGKIPVITGVDWGTDIRPGKKLKGAVQKELLGILRELYAENPVVYALAAEINFSGKTDLTIRLIRDNGRIILSRKNYALNLRKLKLFFGQMNRLSVLEKNEYINLKYADRIVVMNHQ